MKGMKEKNEKIETTKRMKWQNGLDGKRKPYEQIRECKTNKK